MAEIFNPHSFVEMRFSVGDVKRCSASAALLKEDLAAISEKTPDVVNDAASYVNYKNALFNNFNPLGVLGWLNKPDLGLLTDEERVFLKPFGEKYSADDVGGVSQAFRLVVRKTFELYDLEHPREPTNP